MISLLACDSTTLLTTAPLVVVAKVEMLIDKVPKSIKDITPEAVNLLYIFNFIFFYSPLYL